MLYREAEYFGHEENPVAQLGTAYASLGDLGKAHAMFDTALALANENEDPQAVAANTVELAELYREAGEYGRALELFSRAKALDRELGMQLETGADLRSEAEVYAAAGIRDILIANMIFGEPKFERVAALCSQADPIVACDHFAQAEGLAVAAATWFSPCYSAGAICGGMA